MGRVRWVGGWTGGWRCWPIPGLGTTLNAPPRPPARTPQGSNDASLMGGGPERSKGTVVRVRRAMMLEDGMTAITKVR